MMAAILQKMAKDEKLELSVESAGTYIEAQNGYAMSEHGLAELAKRGIDGSAHRSRSLGGVRGLNSFDAIICTSVAEADAVKERIPVAIRHRVTVAPGGIPNPYQRGPEEYARCAATITSVMVEYIEKLRKT